MAGLWHIVLALPPLIALMLSADAPTRRLGRALAPYAPLPALLLTLAWPADTFAETGWWLLEGRFGLDPVGRLFMLLTAALWSLAAFYAIAYTRHDPARDRFWVWFLLAMAGNLALPVSLDIASFYLAFALMSFASFGLVIHTHDAFAHFAAKVYIVMTILGEAMLLVGLLTLGASLPGWTVELIGPAFAEDPRAPWVTALLMGGFGVKAGLLFLHMWLPLAHPAAPTPASAVLSGAMIKAGLLGWIRFLPGGEVSFEALGAALVGLGLAGAFYGVLLGLFQRNPKTNLAYSSVSQIGFMAVAVGVGLVEPSLWGASVLAAGVYALHHAMAKGALFLSVGVAEHSGRGRWAAAVLYGGIALAALSLAGLPLTSGYAAKYALKELVAGPLPAWLGVVGWLLPVAAVGTTLLMGRFVYLIHQRRGEHVGEANPGLWGPWLAVLALVVVLTWLGPQWAGGEALPAVGFAAAGLWAAIWPIALGLALLVLAWRGGRALAWAPPHGDVLVVFLWLTSRLLHAWRGVVIPTSRRLREVVFLYRNRFLLRTSRTMALGELVLVRWGVGGLVFILLILAITAILGVS